MNASTLIVYLQWYLSKKSEWRVWYPNGVYFFNVWLFTDVTSKLTWTTRHRNVLSLIHFLFFFFNLYVLREVRIETINEFLTYFFGFENSKTVSYTISPSDSSHWIHHKIFQIFSDIWSGMECQIRYTNHNELVLFVSNMIKFDDSDVISKSYDELLHWLSVSVRHTIISKIPIATLSI